MTCALCKATLLITILEAFQELGFKVSKERLVEELRGLEIGGV